MHYCDQCRTAFTRKSNLTRHKNNRCKHVTPLVYKEIPTFDGSDFGTGKHKSKELMDKLRRHVLRGNKTVEPPPLKTARIDNSSYSNDESKVKSQIVNSLLSQEPMVKEFLSRHPNDKSPNQQIDTKKEYGRSIQSTKNYNIPASVLKDCMKVKSMGELWCDEDNSISMANSSDEESLSSVDVSSEKDYSGSEVDEKDLSNAVRFLPSTQQGLQKRFNELFYEFTRNKKYEHRNELVFILDEMLRREFITLSKYEELNNILAKTLDKDNLDKEEVEEKEEKEEVEEAKNQVKRLIQSTTEYIIKDDYNELINLIPNIEKEAGPEFVTIVRKLRHLIDKFLQDQYDEDGKVILPRIMDLCRTLTGSPVSRLKIIRLKMLLNDIDENRFRVTSILTRLEEAEDEEDIVNTLEALRREDLISLEQYEKLMVDDAAFDPQTTVMIIKDTKVGRGLKFLPRELTDLKNKIQSAINEENISLKDILVYLDEMFRKNGISVNDYKSIKKEIDNII